MIPPEGCSLSPVACCLTPDESGMAVGDDEAGPAHQVDRARGKGVGHLVGPVGTGDHHQAGPERGRAMPSHGKEMGRPVAIRIASVDIAPAHERRR